MNSALRKLTFVIALGVVIACLIPVGFAAADEEEVELSEFPGVTLSSASAAAKPTERGFGGTRLLDRNDYNVGGMSKGIRCFQLAKGAMGNTRILDSKGNELGLDLHALAPANFSRHCANPAGTPNKTPAELLPDTVNIQMNEQLSDDGGALVYQWGLSNQHYGGAAFGKSGHIRRSDLVNPPASGDFIGSCIHGKCNGKSAPTWYTRGGKARFIKIKPVAMEERMWHPHINASTGKATEWLFNTTRQYGQSASDVGVTTHAPLMWNWTNKKRGGVNRAQVRAGEKFYLTTVQHFGKRTYEPSGISKCAVKVTDMSQCEPNKILWKIARNASNKRVSNGWIELAYGFVRREGKEVYGWMVTRHGYGGTTYKHFEVGGENKNLPWTSAGILEDSFTARSSVSAGTNDDDVNLVDDEFGTESASDFVYDPEEEWAENGPQPGSEAPIMPWGAPAHSTWGSGHGFGSTAQLVGDINGDGRTEPVVFFNSTGSWYGAASGATTFGSYWLMANGRCTNSSLRYLADVNGDKMADAICWNSSAPTQWWVGLSNGSSFATWNLWNQGQNPNASDFFFSDVNGDAKSDLVTVNSATGLWRVALSSGSGLGAFVTWQTSHGAGGFKFWAHDVNGDGVSDAIAFIRSSGTWKVALGNNSSFGASATWISGHGVGSAQQMMGDVDGDGRADAMVYFNQITYGGLSRVGAWFVSLASASNFGGYSLWATDSSYNATSRFLSDTNGDQQADAVGFYGASGLWGVSRAHDIRPPAAKILSGPTNNEVVTTSSTTFTFKTDESAATLSCAIDGGAYAPCSSPLVRTGIPEGMHSLSVKATDAVGRTAESAVSYAVDFKVPQTVAGEVGDAPWLSLGIGEPYKVSLYGDINGDGKDDTLAPSLGDGTWHLMLSTGSRFQFTSDAVMASGCLDGAEPFLADVDNDPQNRADLVCYIAATDSWRVATAGGSYYLQPESEWLATAGMAEGKRFLADVNDDGRDDIVHANAETGEWKVALSTGSGFSAPTVWAPAFGAAADDLLVGDVTGDGMADIASFTQVGGVWNVAASSGTAFEPSTVWRNQLGEGSFDQELADVDGDGDADAIVYFDLIGDWYVARSTGTQFAGSPGNDELWLRDFGNDGSAKALEDVTGDGRADAIGYSSDRREWHAAISKNSKFERTNSESTSARVAMFHSDDPFATFECSLDGAAYAACTNPHTINNVTDGAHTLAVRAKDQVGQIDPTPATMTFSVDRSAPVVTIGSPASGSTSDSTPMVTFGVTDASQVTEVKCAVDGGPAAACVSGSELSALTDGSHTLSVTAVDKWGNSGSASRNFIVDAIAPTVTITSGPTEGSTVAPGARSLSFTADDTNAVFECRVDSAAFASCSSPFTSQSLGDGAHVLSVRARDTFQNLSAVASRSFTVDGVAPDTSISAGPIEGSTIAESTATFEFTSTEAGSTFECRVDAGAYAACASSFTTPTLTDGTHSVSIRAIDGVGNTDQSPATRSFVVSSGIRVNFQPSDAGSIAGYVIDSGATYGDRGNGYTYGWSQSETANMRTRTGTGSSDLRYNTLASLGNTPSAYWRIALPNGQYSVHLAAGDPTYAGTVGFSANGVPLVSGTTTSSNKWIEGTGSVTVSDGTLTVNQSGGLSANSLNYITITPTVADTIAPSAPTGLAATSIGATSAMISWNASTDNVAIDSYDIYLNGSYNTWSTSTSKELTGLTCGTSYSLVVVALDTSSNWSASTPLTLTTSACGGQPDTTPPSAPTNVTISSRTKTSVVVSWTASTDNVGVTGYDIYGNGSWYAWTSSTTFTAYGLSCGTSYTTAIVALDAAGNWTPSATIPFSTLAC